MSGHECELRYPPSPIHHEADGVLMRDFSDGDFPGFYDLVGDAEICRFLPWGPFDEGGAWDFLRKNQAALETKPRLLYRLAAIDPASGEMVGLGAAFVRRPELAELEVGYSLRRPFWGQGWASRMLRNLQRLAFAGFGAHRVIAIVDPTNTASVKVLERGGYRREGHFVAAHRQKDGGWCDELLYAKLADEWRAETGENAAAAGAAAAAGLA